MPKAKPRTPAQTAAQKKRTASNQIKKYEKLLAANPTSKHIKKWQEFIEMYKKA